MKRTEKSVIEIEIEEECQRILGVIAFGNMKVEDAQLIVKKLEQLLAKTEELRISRDNWRAKYEATK